MIRANCAVILSVRALFQVLIHYYKIKRSLNVDTVRVSIIATAGFILFAALYIYLSILRSEKDSFVRHTT